jgi:predicted transcriptional regulator
VLSSRTLCGICLPYVRVRTAKGRETERVEVRLDPETRGKLEEVAAARGSSVSELMRSLIERSHEEEVAGAARLAGVERIGRIEVENVPEPAELKRQLSEL